MRGEPGEMVPGRRGSGDDGACMGVDGRGDVGASATTSPSRLSAPRVSTRCAAGFITPVPVFDISVIELRLNAVLLRLRVHRRIFWLDP